MTALPHVLFAWELGGNFGHVSKIAEVARHLDKRAQLTIAVRDPIAFRRIAPDLNCTLLSAPAAPPPPPTPRPLPVHTYPEGLQGLGWSNVEELGTLAEAWRGLFSLCRPDAIVAQAAPTALLAARGLGIPTAMFGSGFDAPPRSTPMPRFYYWEPERAPSREPSVLETANKVLKGLDQPPMTRFCDLLRTDRYLLATFAEIDHYAPRTDFEPDPPAYLGQLFTTDAGRPMRWKKSAKRRVFAYLRPRTHGFESGVKALTTLDKKTDVILAAPGASDKLAQSLKETPVRLVNTPVRLQELLPDCDLGVSHTSNGIAAAFVMAGVPQVGLPSHAEQDMVARAVAMNRLGLGVLGQFGPDQAFEAIQKALEGTHLREATKAKAQRLAQTLPTKPGTVLAERILEIV